MSRTTVGLTVDGLADLPDRNRECAFWELDPVTRRTKPSVEQRLEVKQAWVADTLLEWGSCGQISYVDGIAAGYLLYAPAAYVPAGDSFATSPASRDSILLTAGEVFPAYRGTGVGRLLVQALAKDLVRRKIRAVEAFASPRRATCSGEPDVPCLLPSDFLLSVGFRTVRRHMSTPRLRLDIRSTVTWRSDVESAVDRLLGTLRPASPTTLRAMSERP